MSALDLPNSAALHAAIMLEVSSGRWLDFPIVIFMVAGVVIGQMITEDEYVAATLANMEAATGDDLAAYIRENDAVPPGTPSYYLKNARLISVSPPAQLGLWCCNIDYVCALSFPNKQARAI